MNRVLRINDLENAEQMLLAHNKEIGRDLSDQELIDGVRKFLANGNVLGFVSDDHIIAMLNLYCNNYDSLEAYICNVYVLPEYRGNHMAERMVQEAIDICREKKFKSVHLHVSEDNKPAVHLYKKLGFAYSNQYRGTDREMVLDLASSKKRLLVLGAGGAQLPLIKEALELGYITIVCDNRPDMEGSKIASKYYQVDYMNLDRVLEIAIEERIDGVISNSEPAMVNVAFISQKLNLIGNSVKSVETLVSKSLFRELQQRIGVFAPNHCLVESIDEFWKKVNTFSFPIIVKPTECCGAKGTIRFDCYDEEGLLTAYDTCKSCSRNGLVSIEEYVPMQDLRVIESDVVVVGDDLIWDGMMWTGRSKDTPMVPQTYILPIDMPEEKMSILKNTVQNIIRGAGIRHGEYNVEAYFADEEKVFVIEINPRQGGNHIPELIKQQSGVNLSKLIVSTAVGDMSYINELRTYKRMHNFVTGHAVYPKDDGIFESLYIDERVKPYVKWVELLVDTGTYIKSGSTVFDSVAFVDLQFDSYETQYRFSYDLEQYIYPVISRG